MQPTRSRGFAFVKNGLGLALMSLASCAAQHKDAAAPLRAQDTIQALLERQVQDWNAGDLEGFMRAYWPSPDLTFFSDGTLTRGWQETFDRYRRRYPDRPTMGRLSFADLVIQPIHPGLAVVSGTWHLQRDTPVGGRFFLVFERHQRRWVIVVDDTTSLLPTAPTPTP